MSNSLKGTLLTVVAGIALGFVRNEWPIPDGTSEFLALVLLTYDF